MEQFLYLHRWPGPVSSLIISNQIVDILGGRAPGWLPLIKMTLPGERQISSVVPTLLTGCSPTFAPLNVKRPYLINLSYPISLEGGPSQLLAGRLYWFSHEKIGKNSFCWESSLPLQGFLFSIVKLKGISLLCLASSEKSCLCGDVITSYIKFLNFSQTANILSQIVFVLLHWSPL